MHTTNRAIDATQGPVTFKEAKIEHFLHRAEDYLQMSRFTKAIETLKTLYSLDTESSAARSLQKRVEYYISSLLDGRHNGSSLSGQKRRRDEIILIVDQDERVLTSLTATLRRHGFRSIGASNYAEAIEALTTYRPDIVVSEVNFETGSAGYDLYLWLRTNTGTEKVPFLFLATRIDRDTLIAGKLLGVSDFVLKPLDEDLVMASILNCIARLKRNEM